MASAVVNFPMSAANGFPSSSNFPSTANLWSIAYANDTGYLYVWNGSTWNLVATGATGTVTSVGLSLPAEFSVAGSPVTTSGTLAGTWANQTQNKVLASPNGSTGAPSFRALVGADLPNPSASTLGGIQSIAAVSSQWIRSISTSGVPALSQPAFTDVSGTATVSQGGTGVTALTAHYIPIGNGTSAVTLLAPGTSGLPLLSQGASADPAYGQVSLTTAVTGTLPVANGGTGVAALTAHYIPIGNGTSAVTLLAPGTSGLPLLSQGASADPAYGQVSLTTAVTGTLPVANGGTGAAALTAHYIPIGNGTSAVTLLAPGTSGYPLLSQGASADPAYGQLNLASAATGTLPAGSFPALTGDVTTSAGSLATTLAATSNGTLATLSKSTGVAIHGTNTNDSASAGYVGEVITNSGSDVTPAASGSFVNITSITLTAGDWDVYGNAYLASTTVNGTRITVGISRDTAALDSTSEGGVASWPATISTAFTTFMPVGFRRISLSATTTIYLVGLLTYTSLGDALFSGIITARRAR